jgi:hypothetical protein
VKRVDFDMKPRNSLIREIIFHDLHLISTTHQILILELRELLVILTGSTASAGAVSPCSVSEKPFSRTLLQRRI